jgi:hypothetical protein
MIDISKSCSPEKKRQMLQLFDIQSKIMVQLGNIDMFKRRFGYYFLHKRKLAIKRFMLGTIAGNS